MKIVLFSHPTFMNSQSMPRFANLVVEGMRARGHQVEVWSPEPKLVRLNNRPFVRKWLGYADQYVLFPAQVRRRIQHIDHHTLFVFADNALGPWVPLVANRPHIVHCHDFLAQRSALGQIPQNPTSWTGQQYQTYIRQGFRHARRFVSVSDKTRRDLHDLLTAKLVLSEVLYNGLNGHFEPADPLEARSALSAQTGIDLRAGYLLHVGGNLWYKNRVGVVELYDAWRRQTAHAALPLMLVGEKPAESLVTRREASPYKADIHFVTGLPDTAVKKAYQGASVFVFPSLSEGFGWPIAEAMASGCLVLTTDEDPMREVAGKAGYLLPRMPTDPQAIETWANRAGQLLSTMLSLPPAERQEAIRIGLVNSQRFNQAAFLDQLECLYKRVAMSK